MSLLVFAGDLVYILREFGCPSGPRPFAYGASAARSPLGGLSITILELPGGLEPEPGLKKSPRGRTAHFCLFGASTLTSSGFQIQRENSLRRERTSNYSLRIMTFLGCEFRRPFVNPVMEL